MERESEWKANEEEEVAEEMGGGLEIKQRRRGKMGREINEASLEKEEEVGNGDQRSVYFDTDQGVWKCRHCTWTYHLSGPGIDHTQKHEGNCQVVMDVETLTQLGTYFDSPIKGTEFNDVAAGLKLREVNQFVAENNLENGNADVKTKEFNNHENILIEEENQNLKNVVAENGSNSHLSSEENSGNEIMKYENEIEECEQFSSVKSGKLEVAEIDVKRVLEEQETHDLYCPNCNSCITKRVILRKRKRTVPESQQDLPPEKVPHVPEASSPPAETEGLGHEDETVFRCLSCFSFFVPTESGFNIFRIFGKREQIPEGNGKKTEAEVPLPVESSTISRGDPSLEVKRSSPALTSLGAAKVAVNGTTIGKNDAGVPLPVKSNGISGADPVMEVNQSPPSLTVSGATEIRKSQSIVNNAADRLPRGPYTNGGGFTGNQAEEDMPSYPTMTKSEGILGESQTTTGKSDAGDGTNKPVVMEPSFPGGISQSNQIINGSMPPAAVVLPLNAEDDIIKSVGMVKPTSPIGTSQSSQNIHGSVPDAAVVINVVPQDVVETGRNNDWDVLKSIVYGGLIESITSLGVVSSSAGADTSTLNICALGLANLIGGLFVIAHDLSELRSNQDPDATNQRDKPANRYWELLGKREHFRRHAVVSILSYIIFGLLPPVIYAFSFKKSDNKEYKLIAVAAASLVCIALLAIGKAHVKPQKDYIKCLLYYLGLGVSASGLSYVAGVMIDRLLVELGLFNNTAAAPSPPSSIEYLSISSGGSAWASL